MINFESDNSKSYKYSLKLEIHHIWDFWTGKQNNNKNTKGQF